jgi:hypothetical protein
VSSLRPESDEDAVMKGAREYIVVAGVDRTFEALREAVRQRNLSIAEEDPRHRRLAFRLDRPHEGELIKALCTILDVGHGLSKMVVVCVDDADGSVVAPDASLDGLFIQVEHTLHVAKGKRMGFALPRLTQVAPPVSTGIERRLARWQ